jgi:ribonuclease BN (tRNA processing enzyme)
VAAALTTASGVDTSPMRIDRRAFVGGARCGAAALWPARSAAQQKKTRLILLGTAGGPRPRPSPSAAAQVVLINDAAYLVDCGDGVARQLTAARVAVSQLRHIFITHHHSDHNADLGNLIWLSWAELPVPVNAWGPPPIEQMWRSFLELNAFDISTRIADEGRPPLAPLLRPREITKAGLVMQDDNVKVTAALVPHPPIEHAFAYRFDTADRSIVISGDTARSDALITLATGADVLVHEVLWVPAVDRITASLPRATTLKKHIIDSHTSAEDVGRVAQAAGVKTLVLSHFVPAGDPSITDQMWLEAARTHFRGTVVVGKDLMEV